MSASQPPSAASTSALASGVASRFVSADALEQAKQKRAEEWKEAYKRLGQEPPPELVAEDEAYDPRSLYERLQENKVRLALPSLLQAGQAGLIHIGTIRAE
jgi:hypothetical protein